MNRICVALRAPKGEIFADLKDHLLCFDIPQVKPELPKGDPGPVEHLRSLMTIVELSASLPARLPQREELRNLAKRALDAAVADLGPDVKVHYEGVKNMAHAV